jgi:hypothetical protein
LIAFQRLPSFWYPFTSSGISVYRFPGKLEWSPYLQFVCCKNLHHGPLFTLEFVSLILTLLSCRTIPICAARLYYLNPASLSTNRVLATSLVVVCTQLQIGYGMLAAAVSCLRPFVAVYETSHGNQYSNLTNSRAIAGSKKPSLSAAGSSSFPPHSGIVRLANARARSPIVTDFGLGEISTVSSTRATHRPSQSRSYTAIIARPTCDQLHSSHDGEKMIIQRKTDWSVHYEPQDPHAS